MKFFDMLSLMVDLLSGKKERTMKKEKHHMLKIIIKGLIREGYSSGQIYRILLDLGSAYRFSMFLEDCEEMEKEIREEEGKK